MIYGESFRPWGLFPWVYDRLSCKKWNLLGCVSPEERSLGAIYNCIQKSTVVDFSFIEVIDPDSIYAELAKEKREMHTNELVNLIGKKPKIDSLKLFSTAAALKKHTREFISNSNGNVILDISTLPKRFFFPIVKDLLSSDDVKNLIVTYTLPLEYYDGNLAEDPKPWDYLPRYQHTETYPLPAVENAVVGVGFLPFGLPELLKDNYSDAKVTLLFPFPPGPPNYQRTWEFVREIEKFRPLEDDSQIIRIDVLDVPGCYQQISTLGDNGKKHTIFAPYGPKSHSLAMCLYAAKYDCDVFYTQPSSYHPDYSLGMKYINNAPETYAYCIKLNNNLLY